MRKTKRNSKNTTSEVPEIGRDLIEQADVCCREARLAARMKRLRAACGLFETALSLLRRAIKSDSKVKNEASERFSQISTEAAIYAELCRDTPNSKSPQAVRVHSHTPRN